MLFEKFRRFPALLATAAYGLGIYLASVSAWPGRYRTLCLFPLLLLGLSVLAYRHSRIRSWILAAFFFCLALIRVGDHFFAPMPETLADWIREARPIAVEFRAEDYGQSDGRRCVFPARILAFQHEGPSRPADLRIRLSVEAGDCKARPGGIYAARVRFREARNFQNPSSFDYSQYLRGQDFWGTGYAVTPVLPIAGTSSFFGLAQRASELRDRLIERMETAIVSPEARGVLQAMMLRETRHLSPEIKEAFRRTGLSHLLVVSGLNFGLVFGFFYYPLHFLLNAWKSAAERGWARRMALVLAIAPTLWYGAMVGWTPPVLRSLATVLAMGTATIAGWRKNFFSLLLLTALVLWIWRPLLFWDVSFQLSFAAVLSVYFFSREYQACLRALPDRMSRPRKILIRFPLFLFCLSVAVNLALYPWYAQNFHEISLCAPLANLLLVPVFSWILMPGSMLAAALDGTFPGAAAEVLGLLGGILQLCLRAIGALAEFRWASVFVPPLQGLQWLAAAFFLLGLFQFSRPRRAMALALAAVLIAGSHRYAADFKPVPAEMRLTMIDVGQGDALMLGTPEGQTLLIDGGGLAFSDFDLGKNVLLPELLVRGSPPIDAIVLTHAHADHYKGLVFLLKRWPVKEFWLTEQAWRHPEFAGLREAALARNISIRFLEQGDRFEMGGADLEVLWPPRLEAGSGNDQSVVLRSCFKAVCFLLTGDIEGRAEAALLASPRSLQSHVLKVAHHGSRTSSAAAFLDKVSPRLALASLGKDNRFRFPHTEVVERFEALGISMLRTDRDGQIEVFTDGSEMAYRTFLEGIKERRVPSRWLAILREVFFERS